LTGDWISALKEPAGKTGSGLFTISRTGARADAVGPGQPRGLDLALKDGDRVAQDQDLGVLGAVGPGEQGKAAEIPALAHELSALGRPG
jgi:hypothetical protein